MKKFYLTVFLMIAATGGFAAEQSQPDGAAKTNEPQKLAITKTRVKCSVCRGKGRLKVSPPDHGQYGGKIESKSHWDITLDPCPICEKGRGWRTVWDLTQPEPSTEQPCLTCGWSGLVQCRRCLASGITKCTNSGCKDGWMVIKKSGSYGKSSSNKPPTVAPCSKCKGVGMVVCPECKGMRANVCKRCFGTGRNRR